MDAIKFKQARNYTKGRTSPIELVVLHDMEAQETSKTAENVAAWFSSTSAPKASCHYCIDNDSIVQCVQDSDVAWHAPGANHNGIGLEHAGYASQNRAQWMDKYSMDMLRRSAELTATLCHKYNLPAEFVDAKGLLAKKKGITTHWEVTKAFKKSTHTDPGKNFPMDIYLQLVQEFLFELV